MGFLFVFDKLEYIIILLGIIMSHSIEIPVSMIMMMVAILYFTEPYPPRGGSRNFR